MRRRWVHVLLFVGSFSLLPATETCRPIEGITPLVREGRILLLGEIHGTVESPAFALDVACHAAHAGLGVVLGLELSPAGQGRVDAFLDSVGAASDRSAVLAGRFWQQDYQDGRASGAMFDLLQGARRMRRAGKPVRVALFDASGRSGGQERERDMARNLASVAAASPDAMLIVLTGNWHSRITKGSPRNAEYEPMGYLLERATSPERVMALNAAHGGGTAWVCAPDCGVTRLAGRDARTPWTVEIDDATRPAGHQGWYHIGSTSASAPATRPLAAAPPASPVAADPPPSEATAARTKPAPAETAPSNQPSAAGSRLDGDWQAYDFSSQFKTWKFHFGDRRFHATAGEDDWYEGRVALQPDGEPAQIDFAIEDCVCSYKGMTSEAIYYWDGDAIVISAPRPGSPRPNQFVEQSGQMMRLLKLEQDE